MSKRSNTRKLMLEEIMKRTHHKAQYNCVENWMGSDTNLKTITETDFSYHCPPKKTVDKKENESNLLKNLDDLDNKIKRVHQVMQLDQHCQSCSNDHLDDYDDFDSVILPRLQPLEREFLQLVHDDDVARSEKFINDHPGFNINCVNFQGISALHIAVTNQSEDMVELLLKQPKIDIGDTVLLAVRVNNIKLLEMLLEAQKKVSPGLEFAGVTHSADFPQYLTPIILAAQAGHYEAVALLVSRGHKITFPHPPKCTCDNCWEVLTNEDPLHSSSARLSIYRAMASPAYLVHVCSDPILASFCLTAELNENAAEYRQLAPAYLQLREDVSSFAVDLIGCCRTSEEVEILLRQNCGAHGQRNFVLPRLLMAVDFKQKEFVAHPNTQQVLESYWLGDWYAWRRKSVLGKCFLILTRVFVTPFILIMCMIAPWHRLVKCWQVPLNKLITHVTAYFVFLAIVFFISNQDKINQVRGPPNTGLEGLLILYVCGYTWSAFRICVMHGPRLYFSTLWNWAEVIMIILFGLTFYFWFRSAFELATEHKNITQIERKYWNQHDPILLAEGTFCLGTILAFLRLMFLCQLNYHLGPLQVSLGKMAIDINKYIIVFAIIISAFAAGLARFYQYYKKMVHQDEFGVKKVQVSSFTSLSDTLYTLFWALFCMAPLESADVVLENVKHHITGQENAHGYTEQIGYFCFGCFEVISVIVVLNMLIATMSNTFQRVNDNAAIEWTFGRTEVYLDYMMQTTLPSPYNLIPTPIGLLHVFQWLRGKLISSSGIHSRFSLTHCCYIERDIEQIITKDYPALMSVLVQRYFRDKDSMYSGEFESLRREITSLRFMLDQPQHVPSR